jgi:hypothetical protein
LTNSSDAYCAVQTVWSAAIVAGIDPEQFFAIAMSAASPAVSLFPEYPDGDQSITAKVPSASDQSDFGHVGWATVVLKHTKGVHKDRLRKQCLGVFACSVKECVFAARPKTQPKAREKQAAELECSTHKAAKVRFDRGSKKKTTFVFFLSSVSSCTRRVLLK